jgi:molybdopterin-guanine dinucleotide biosynthesis protein A
MDSCVIFMPPTPALPEDPGGEPTAMPPYFRVLIERLSPLFPEVLLSTAGDARLLRSPIPVLMVPPATRGRLAALHAAIEACEGNPVFAAGADRPLPDPRLIRHMRQLAEEFDVVIPRHAGSYEPLFAFYTRRCLRPMEEALDLENRRVASFFEKVRVRCVDTEELAEIDPCFLSLRPIGNQLEYDAALKESGMAPDPPPPAPAKRAPRRTKQL